MKRKQESYLVPELVLLAGGGSELEVAVRGLDKQADVGQVRVAGRVLIRNLEHGNNQCYSFNGSEHK